MVRGGLKLRTRQHCAYYAKTDVKVNNQQEGFLSKLGRAPNKNRCVTCCYLKSRVLAKSHLISDKIFHLYGKFASFVRQALNKTRVVFPHITLQLWYLFQDSLHGWKKSTTNRSLLSLMISNVLSVSAGTRSSGTGVGFAFRMVADTSSSSVSSAES